jgi:hypothetical protein
VLTRWIVSAIAAGMVLAGCAGALDVPSTAPPPTTPLPTSNQTPTVDQPTPTAEPTLSAVSLTQRCTNSKYKFSVSYPRDWFTNEAAVVQGDQVVACTLFAPFAEFDVLPEVINVPIFLKHEDGSLPEEGTELSIDGRPAVLMETEVNGVAWYVYYAEISQETRFAAFAFDNGSAPFEESRAVLDAMIGTVDLHRD